jgi:tRNA A58 N-methylase Trm61
MVIMTITSRTKDSWITSTMKNSMLSTANYIEHVIDPVKDLMYMLDHLTDDGKLIFFTPCFEHCYEFTHYHTFFFTPKALEVLSEKLNIRETFSKKVITNDPAPLNFTYVKVFERIKN